mmetsp:Transcript_30939/g.90468  ORF Transcript_30939/g.90468 Transcript_30939/m.90468 type:complete len:125 (+) Transcript_30939:159-533(+)|eukprot:CAMPEP_0181074066 /NCGR_PEP_ID=MMETSP1070-20121207/29413_1 /TAXON_ID=265543 /ORGANISM="Minutocellus polymorphus, Strain NH13" /LENGTH=124 /DNA_ID=CAMNT_0023155177 /DNA_START=298 /DNA_END=672 /DNA_ORIENTATION=-
MTATVAHCDEETGEDNSGKAERADISSHVGELNDDEEDACSLKKCIVENPFCCIGLLLVAIGGVVSAFAPAVGGSMLGSGLLLCFVLCIMSDSGDVGHAGILTQQRIDASHPSRTSNGYFAPRV